MRYPLLYQTNVRLTLNSLSDKLGRQATLDDLTDEALQDLQELGFDWLYLICMWETGQAEAELARSYASLRAEARQKLGIEEQGLCSSCFAISSYNVPPAWGGRAALLRLKERLNRLGMKLMLDFIPNHVGISHPWTIQHPEYFIETSPEKARSSPGEYYRVTAPDGDHYYAHGRDPYFPPWSDTLQLNYANPALQAAMQEQLLSASQCCDGLRCDMAMLVLPEVFQHTWGLKAEPFWAEALAKVKQPRPDFTFMAEVYWGLERKLLQLGFDYTYDKTLYDRLVEGSLCRVIEQIQSEISIIDRQVHFLENHDEKRAALVFPSEKHTAAAIITYLLPGLRFFYNGQLQGHTLYIPMQFCREPVEATDPRLEDFYQRLLAVLREASCQPGSFRLLPAPPLGKNTPDDGCLAFSWLDETGKPWLVVVNYSDHPSQCWIELPFPDLAGRRFELIEKLKSGGAEPVGSELAITGLSLSLKPWGYHAFEVVVPG